MWFRVCQMFNIPKCYDILVEKPIESDSESDNATPPCHREDGQLKYLQRTLNSINAFILSQVT